MILSRILWEFYANKPFLFPFFPSLFNREQQQLALENPIQAAATGKGGQVSNVENLLDIDFDGGVPASASTPTNTNNDLFGGGGGSVDSASTSRVASPVSANAVAPANNMDDLLGVFGNGDAPGESQQQLNMNDDILGGFGGLNMGGGGAGGRQQQQKTAKEDILSLF